MMWKNHFYRPFFLCLFVKNKKGIKEKRENEERKGIKKGM
jgi:hypothetical protein